MARVEEEAVYTVDAYVTVGGTKIPVADITVTNSINDIPTAVALLPLGLVNAKIGLFVSTDAANNAKNKVYDICLDAKDNDSDVSIDISTTPIGGVTAAFGGSFSVSGWKLTSVALQPQNRVSPGGVVIVAKHPMCKLMDAAGFFYAPGADYERLLSGMTSNNIIEAADNMLDLISKTIDSKDYTKLKLGVTGDYDVVKKRASEIRLKNWIECDGASKGWPFTKLVGGEDYSKACSTAFALNFMKNVSNSVPYSALLSISNQLGLFIAPSFDGGKKAKLKVLNPWKRKGSSKFNDYEIYNTQVTRDSDPICGVRLFETPKDVLLISNYAGAKPVDDDTHAYGGEIVYCFGTKGRMINTTIPAFIYEVFSKLHKIVAAKKMSAFSTGGETTRASNTTFENPEANLVSSGTEAENLSVLDILQAAVAKTIFIAAHRRTQRASVIKPFIDSGDIVDLGSFSTFKAGTGGDNAKGMVTSVILQASCSRGTCTVTIESAYCGDPAKLGGNGAILENDMWGGESDDE